MTRVTYVIPSLSVGGTEWQLVHLMRGLVPDHRITVICTRHDGALSGDARRIGVNVRVIGSPFGGWDYRMRCAIRRILRGNPPDILHTFMFGFDLCANLAARDVGVPVVISSRRQLATWRKVRHRWLARRANQLVDCIVANSQAVARFAAEQERADPALFRVIPNGIHADDFTQHGDLKQIRRRYGIPASAPLVGTVANFAPVKGYPLFLDMAERLLARRSDYHFLMVGSGPEAADIERRIRARGLADHFTRVATVSERPDIYGILDVFVLCSEVEGFPNAVIEAMAAGKPVVAAAVGGIPELIENGQTGILLDARRPEIYADAVTRIEADPARARAMAQRAAAVVRERLPMHKMVNAYRELYAELLERARKRGG
ncbi:MAG TPA: glycosyltransferase [Candidatus Hydrogenedentes bacterium]|nr:glycosyltransferase [Candidatus Hydrogenedentota bacterium]HPG65707.1 glycosyltransferase [Candidatus Hydrogenedentota bacterium]